MVDIIITIAEILIISSYLFTDILALRLLAVFGMTTYVLAGFLAGYEHEGMKALIFFSTVAAVCNIIQIIRIIRERAPVSIPPDLKTLYSEVFSMMTEKEFLYLYSLSMQKNYAKSTTIIQENEQQKQLILIKEGSVNIVKNAVLIAQISNHHFIGEINYITGRGAITSVIAASDQVQCLLWSHDVLRKLEHENSQLYKQLFSALAIDLINKIVINNEKQLIRGETLDESN